MTTSAISQNPLIADVMEFVQPLLEQLPAPCEERELEERCDAVCRRLLEYHARTPLAEHVWGSVLQLTAKAFCDASVHPFRFFNAMAGAVRA